MSSKTWVAGLMVLGLARSAAGAELLVFDWNKPVPKTERGFPWDQPPKNGVNGDWTTPTDYENGTLYYRVQIKSQPVAQDMNVQFCFWQKVPDRETCGPHQAVKGTPGTVVTWSCDVQKMWKKNNLPVDWTKPRDRNGVAIKDTSFKCVSDYAGWNWNGHDPNKWYPLDMRFTVVVVSKGSTFSGWPTYVGSTKAPAITTAGASQVTTSSARLGGAVTDTGGADPTVVVHWGATDGKTDATKWDHAEALGKKAKGSFHKDVNGLTAGKTYHYRCKATNAGGTAWSPASVSFTTKPQAGDSGPAADSARPEAGVVADGNPPKSTDGAAGADQASAPPTQLDGDSGCSVGGAGRGSSMLLLLLVLLVLPWLRRGERA